MTSVIQEGDESHRSIFFVSKTRETNRHYSRNLKLFFSFEFSLILFFSFFAVGTAYAQDKSYEIGASRLYENHDFSYEMSFPTEWELGNESNADVFIRHYGDNGLDASLQISSSIIEEPTDLNKISNNTIDTAEVSAYGSIESNRSTVSNVESRILYYNTSDETGRDRTVMQEIALKNDNLYSLNYVADQSVYSTYLPTVKYMLQTFKIIDFLPYEDPVLGIRINYPSNWNKTSFGSEYGGGIDFTSPSINTLVNDKASISISRTENILSESLDEIVNRTVDRYKQTLNSFTLIEPVLSNTSDNKSKVILFSYEDDMLGTMKVFEINFIHGKWIYSLQYKADKSIFSKYSAIMSRMIDSFNTLDFLPYEDPDLGIRINYPSNWTVAQEENSIRFTSFQESNADFKDNLLILEDNPGNYSLADQEFDVNLKPNTINITSPYTTTVAGYPAKGIRTEFLDKDTDRNVIVEDIVSVINHRKYELIFFSEPSTYDIYLPTIQSMINSIKIANFSFYQNPNLRFDMSFPSDWKIREEADNVKITSAPENQSDTFREYLSVRSPITLSGNYTLNSYLQELISSLSQVREDLHFNRTYSGGQTNFTTLQYNFTSRGEQYSALGVFPVFNNKVYPIFFYAKPTSYQSHLPTIKYMINSFKGIDFSSYRDPNLGIIKYPSHWSVHENGKKVQFFSPLESNNDIFQEHLDITYGPSDSVNGSIGCDPKGEGPYDLDLDSESEHKRYTILGNTVRDRESICSYSDGVNNFKKMSTFMTSNASNASLYALHFYTEASKYESYLPTIKYMINSFKIADVKSYDNFLLSNNTFASIKYPSEWNVTMKTASELDIESPFDASSGSVVFAVSTFIPSSNLEENVAVYLNGLKQNITDFKLIKIGSSTPLNHSSYEIVYTGVSEGTSFMERDTFSTSGSLGYLIRYWAEADSYYSYLPVIKNIIDSLVIKPTGKSPPNPSGLVFDSPILDLAVNPLTHKVYLSSDVANTIYVLDESTGRLISNITVKGFPNFVSLHPSANKIFVVSPEFDQIYVINGYSDNVTSIIQVGKNPAQLALDPTDYTSSGRKGLLFVTTQDDNNVEIIDASNEESLKNVTVGQWPYGIVVNPVTTKAYVTNSGDGTVSVIDYGYNSNNTLFAKVIATVDVQSSPMGIAVDPYKNHIFVANSGAGNISVINGLDNRVINNVSAGIFPQFLLFNKNTSELYITESANNTISVMNMSQSTHKPMSISTDGIATDMEIDPINNWIVMSSYDGKSLSFINGSSPHNTMVRVSFNISPPQTGQIICNGKIVRPNTIAVMDVGTICKAESMENFDFSGWSEKLRNNVLEFSQHNFENSTSVASNNTIMSNNDTIKIQKNSILTANFRHIDSFVDVLAQFGLYISTGTLIAVIILASLSQYLFRTRRGGKQDTQDWVMDKISLITIDASVIVGVLIFLSLEGFSESQQTQVALVTANIVFPFALSAIFSVVNHLAFGTRLMVAGFVNLMVSIIIITIIKL